jgi:predicted TIM-barrel fold metal-dependent hydrolase
MRGTLAVLERRNIVAVVIGSVDQVSRWKAAAPNRVIPALLLLSARQHSDTIDPHHLRELLANHHIQVLGEVLSQYQGIAPNDPVLEPLFAVAEESDIPVGIHVGPGPAGAAYNVAPKYRAALGNPLLLEDVLIRHPKLRLYVMHAGWPLADEMVLLLYAHPQVYVDISVIDWILPRAEFHRYLRRLVDAGFGKRVMFGSDMFIAPAIIDYAIDAVQSADFLTADQKRDILYNNAARFLRLDTGGRD